MRTLVNDHLESGAYSVVWDGTNQSGVPVASGVYLCRLDWDRQQSTNRLVFVRQGAA